MVGGMAKAIMMGKMGKMQPRGVWLCAVRGINVDDSFATKTKRRDAGTCKLLRLLLVG